MHKSLFGIIKPFEFIMPKRKYNIKKFYFELFYSVFNENIFFWILFGPSWHQIRINLEFYKNILKIEI